MTLSRRRGRRCEGHTARKPRGQGAPVVTARQVAPTRTKSPPRLAGPPSPSGVPAPGSSGCTWAERATRRRAPSPALLSCASVSREPLCVRTAWNASLPSTQRVSPRTQHAHPSSGPRVRSAPGTQLWKWGDGLAGGRVRTRRHLPPNPRRPPGLPRAGNLV